MLSYSAMESGVGRCSADQGPLHTYSMVWEAGICRGQAGRASSSLSDATCCIAKVSTASASLSESAMTQGGLIAALDEDCAEL